MTRSHGFLCALQVVSKKKKKKSLVYFKNPNRSAGIFVLELANSRWERLDDVSAITVSANDNNYGARNAHAVSRSFAKRFITVPEKIRRKNRRAAETVNRAVTERERKSRGGRAKGINKKMVEFSDRAPFFSFRTLAGKENARRCLHCEIRDASVDRVYILRRISGYTILCAWGRKAAERVQYGSRDPPQFSKIFTQLWFTSPARNRSALT